MTRFLPSIYFGVYLARALFAVSLDASLCKLKVLRKGLCLPVEAAVGLKRLLHVLLKLALVALFCSIFNRLGLLLPVSSFDFECFSFVRIMTPLRRSSWRSFSTSSAI